ncbi:type II toxin-antitoxin system PemK/MazF family toxin [Pararhodonellum marinum]|uniref:type II toxin-antitoxin system PemK/MazF family toxin n=1 Tax=Pararhodonellum marinum TaxID=2755358 RepID=UPI00188E4DFA|nr:type II toxin-antitoxin system PemK/MazF family toxin [Pararhodonellum marinum]
MLRVHLKKDKFGLNEDFDIMIDQVRAIDNNSLLVKIGAVDRATTDKLKENLSIL